MPATEISPEQKAAKFDQFRITAIKQLESFAKANGVDLSLFYSAKPQNNPNFNALVHSAIEQGPKFRDTLARGFKTRLEAIRSEQVAKTVPTPAAVERPYTQEQWQTDLNSSMERGNISEYMRLQELGKKNRWEDNPASRAVAPPPAQAAATQEETPLSPAVQRRLAAIQQQMAHTNPDGTVTTFSTQALSWIFRGLDSGLLKPDHMDDEGKPVYVLDAALAYALGFSGRAGGRDIEFGSQAERLEDLRKVYQEARRTGDYTKLARLIASPEAYANNLQYLQSLPNEAKMAGEPSYTNVTVRLTDAKAIAQVQAREKRYAAEEAKRTGTPAATAKREPLPRAAEAEAPVAMVTNTQECNVTIDGTRYVLVSAQPVTIHRGSEMADIRAALENGAKLYSLDAFSARLYTIDKNNYALQFIPAPGDPMGLLNHEVVATNLSARDRESDLYKRIPR